MVHLCRKYNQREEKKNVFYEGIETVHNVSHILTLPDPNLITDWHSWDSILITAKAFNH